MTPGHPQRFPSLLALLLAGSCAEPSIEVSFKIPSEFLESETCILDCDEEYRYCLQPDPERCRKAQEECMLDCDQAGSDECWRLCDAEYQSCMNPGQNQQCDVLFSTCQQACKQRVVWSASLQVLRPPDVNPFVCDGLAFGDVPEEVLAASLLQEVFLQPGSGQRSPLVGIDRLAEKVLLAQGLDLGGDPVVVGCAEIGDIEGPVEVEIAPEPAAVVDVQEESNGASMWGDLPAQVALRLSDARARSLSGVETRYQVVGAGGWQRSGSAVSDANGMVLIFPESPANPGPAILDLQVRWSRGTLPQIAGFKSPRNQRAFLPAGLRDLQIGRVGRTGGVAFVGLSPCRVVETSLCLVRYEVSSSLAEEEIAIEPNPGLEGAVLAIAPGAQQDRVMVLGADLWLELSGSDGGWIPRDSQVLGGAIPQTAVGLPACSGLDDEGSLWIGGADQGVVVVSVDGTQLVDSPLARMMVQGTRVVSGCVSDQTGQQRRVVAVDRGGGGWLIGAQVGEALLELEISAPLATLGFAPPCGDEPATLLLGKLGASGPEITASRLAFQAGTTWLALDPLRRVELVAAADSVAGGDMDGDGKIDVVGLFLLRNAAQSYASYAQATLGVEHRGQAISGLFPVGGAGAPPRLWMQDFNGDGVDDWAVWSSELSGSGNPGGEDCLLMCDREYESCLQQGAGQECEAIYQECKARCGAGDGNAYSQTLDLYLMGA